DRPMWGHPKMAPVTMLCSCQYADARTERPAGEKQARKVLNPRPSVLETAAPPLARAQRNDPRMTWCAGERMQYRRRRADYKRTRDRPLFAAASVPSCLSSRGLPGRHGYAPTLDGADPRSFDSTMCMRAIDVDSTHSPADVNGL